jgi:signal peptidase
MLAVALARLDGLEFQVVTSGSMQPAIAPGDVAVTQPVPVAELSVGDVIAFYPPDDRQPRLHRIVTITSDHTITTRGDANPVVDPWHATLRGPTAYRLVAVIPLVGWVVQFRGLLLIAAGLLLAVALVYDLGKEKQLMGPSQA